MTARRMPHLTMTHRWRTELPIAERVLHAIGATPEFADAVLGDLAEERARVAAERGVVAARWWYVCEAMRAVPHLAWNAVRHGGASARIRMASVAAVLALVATVALVLLLRGPAPAKLVMDAQRGGIDGIVLNTMQPVRLTIRVLDARGRTLPPEQVRFERMAGTALPVTSDGVVTCTSAGDALVRASVGKLQTTTMLHCRPVKEFLTELWIPLLAGGPPRDMRFMGVGPDNHDVEVLAGDLHIADSTVATLRGRRLTPVAPGHTFVRMRIGSGETITSVSVFTPVRTFMDRRPDQRFVAVPVEVQPRRTLRHALPVGQFWLLYENATDSMPVPKFVTDGAATCTPALGPGVSFSRCLVRGPGAALRIVHPGGTRAAVTGTLSLEMDPIRR
jgi:hypothetical protein